MKVFTVDGRACVDTGAGPVDVAHASGGRFGPDPLTVFEHWDDFRRWADRRLDPPWAESIDGTVARLAATARLGSPVCPRQVLAVGFNYADHSTELSAALPERPVVFPKLSSSVSGPADVVPLPGAQIDWEVELVAVVGRHARHVRARDAWRYVAGLTVGQDLTDRAAQFEGATPQYSLSKSLPGFTRIGPCITTIDQFDDPDDLAISCTLNGELVQQSRTGRLVFGVGDLIEHVSARVPLLPGDLIFTGTPSGVGFSRNPPRYLVPDDVLIGTVEGIGDLVTTFAAPPPAVES